MKQLFLLLFLAITLFSCTTQNRVFLRLPSSLKPISQNQASNFRPVQNAVHYHAIPFLRPLEGDFKSFHSNERGQLTYLEGTPHVPAFYNARSTESVAQAAYHYLNTIKEAMQIKNPKEEVVMLQNQTDNLGFVHLKMQQYFQGVKVYGGQIVLHGNGGQLNAFNGTYYPTPKLSNLSPSLTQASAINKVLSDIPKYVPYHQLSTLSRTLLHGYHGPFSELVIYHLNHQANQEMLCYHVTIMANALERWEYFVDAQNGNIVHQYKNMCSDGPGTAQATDLSGVSRNINTYSKSGTWFLIDASRSMFNLGQSTLPDNPVGAIWTIDAQNSGPSDIILHQNSSSNNRWNNPKAVSAHYHAGLTYEYYKNTFGRNSIDGNGGTITSVINVANDDGSGSNPPGELPLNPGQDYILSYDVNSSDPNTLYISNTGATDFTAISTTEMKRKVSIVDNGAVGLFIGEDNSMNTILLTSPYTEQAISPDYIWDNAAASKDGNRIAAITTDVDSTIYVYDYTLGWKRFHLYNPTFTPGITTDNVLYADAIEWDYSGNFLIYDAYNTLQNSNGDVVDYWDMNMVRVWNSAANTWGDGQIFKIFSNMPEGINVGNPCLSKNSPYILAFDYLDNNTGEMDVMAVNLETGDVGTLFANNPVLGFPNYSKADNQIVFDSHNQVGDEVVATLSLQSDKIHPTGTATALIDVAKWPVWYATGNRNLTDVKETGKASAFVSIYPNPVSGRMNVALETTKSENYRIEIYNLTGSKLLSMKGISVPPVTHQKVITKELYKGTYVVKITMGHRQFTKKMVKL